MATPIRPRLFHRSWHTWLRLLLCVQLTDLAQIGRNINLLASFHFWTTPVGKRHVSCLGDGSNWTHAFRIKWDRTLLSPYANKAKGADHTIQKAFPSGGCFPPTPDCYSYFCTWSRKRVVRSFFKEVRQDLVFMETFALNLSTSP